jgi:PAS domain S-box-containing protein
VLVLHSYHVGLPWNDALQRGLQSGLGERAEGVQLYHEHLDALRTDAPTRARWARNLTERYRDLQLDYLLATDDPAYQLLLGLRAQIAPGKPLLFAGVNNITRAQLAGMEGVAGIAETPDFAANLALMRRLHPTHETLVVVGDATPTFASNLAALQTSNAAQPVPFRVTVMEGATLEQIRAQLVAIPTEALIFLMGRPRDSVGNLVTGPAVARFVRSHTQNPIYTGWDFFLGHGVVGGMLVAGEAQGQALASALTRVLQGQPIGTLAPVSDSPNHYAFDYAELQRFDIPVSALPDTARVINRPVQVWDAHPVLFFAVVSAFVVLVMLMGFLIFVMLIKRRAAQRVQQELALMQGMMDAAPYPMFFKDTAMVYQRVNDAFVRFFGKDRESLVGASVGALTATERAAFFDAKDMELLASKQPQVHEAPVLAQDGTEHDIVFHKGIVRTPDGMVAGIVGAMLDVTPIRQAESALRSLNQNLETRVTERTAQLARANSELERTIDTLSLAQDEITRQERFASLGAMVAGVAHELNTPIGNSLVVATTLEHDTAHFVQALADGAVRRSTLSDYTERCTQAASMLVRCLERAAQLVKNFKDVAVDQSSDRRRHFTLAHGVADIVQTFEAGARGAIPQVVIDIPPEIELDSYPGALGQILLNLLENARIHAFADVPAGQVRIAAALLDSQTVRINFGDNGVGIAGADLPRIFDPFFTTRLGQGGSGLGLSIVYRLVTHTLGGRIGVSSDTGRGAMFIIDLPLHVPERPQDMTDPLALEATTPDDAVDATPLHLRDNLLDIRELVESNAASLAASNATDADRQRLRITFEALDTAFASDDLETQIQRDLAFHMGIIEATHDAALHKVGNAVLQLMYGHIRRNLSTLSPNPDRRAALRRQHQAIFDAIVQRNPAAASAAAGDHMRYVRAEGKRPLVGEHDPAEMAGQGSSPH